MQGHWSHLVHSNRQLVADLFALGHPKLLLQSGQGPAILDPKHEVIAKAKEAAINALLGIDWSPFLAGGEELLLAGPVLKSQAGHGRLNTKQLILTDKPRIFYVDAGSFKSKDCDLKFDAPEAKSAAKSNVLRVYQKDSPFKVQTVLHPPHKWVSALESALHPDLPSSGKLSARSQNLGTVQGGDI